MRRSYSARQMSQVRRNFFSIQVACIPLDDDTYLDTTSPSHSVGEIKLAIARTTVPEFKRQCTTTNGTSTTAYIALPHLQKVHERSNKAIAHHVK